MLPSAATKFFGRRARLASLAFVALAAVVGFAALQMGSGDERQDVAQRAAAVPPPLRYDTEYPAIPYRTGQPTDAVAQLAARIERGQARLTFTPGRGYLDSLLEALEIDPSSQTLVFSQTSLQNRQIRPATPRAIYFNDEVYVAWVQQGPIEIAAVDPNLGQTFYLLEQTAQAAPEFTREFTRCLSCHDSYSLSGGGVPRVIVGSGYTGTNGALVSHEGWILVTDHTPFKSRWGGWYVTGKHGRQVHLGNMLIKSYDDFEHLEELRVGNLDDLDALFDTQPYLTNKSDIVALLVLEHQADVHNLITRVSYDTRTILAATQDAASQAATQLQIKESVEPLVEMMLFVDAIEFTDPIEGIPAFTEQFVSRAVRDPQGRSLRDFDLSRRIFRYPLSYLIYSTQFDALPSEANQAFYGRLAEVLQGEDTSEPFAHLATGDRTAILEILRATKPEFARFLTQSR
jgi:hypothetical protein